MPVSTQPVTVRNVELDVQYYWTDPEPQALAELEIEGIFHLGENITDLVTEETKAYCLLMISGANLGLKAQLEAEEADRKAAERRDKTLEAA